MLETLKETYGKAIQRLRHIQEIRQKKKQQNLLDDMSFKLFQLKTKELDIVDLSELEEAQDIINIIYEEYCID